MDNYKDCRTSSSNWTNGTSNWGYRVCSTSIWPDLRFHPVGRFLIGAVENFDRRQIALVCYSDVTIRDELTARFQAAAALWRDIRGASDDRVARQIAADRIDLLVDLCGHTANNRLLLFARKPAPRQATWIGYEGTTGLEAIDYLLADRYLVPPESEPYYVERVVRLPDSHVCYEPGVALPPIALAPPQTRGPTTFGSFNNPAKYTAPVIHAWAEILRQVPGARLLLKYRGLDQPQQCERYRQWFAAEGIDARRVEFRGFSATSDYLASYNEVDVALDTFPFNGGATTCDALVMGVPVVTWPGETFASRHSLSFLSTAGVPQCIARDQDDYVRRAVELAGDVSRLADWRRGLRDQVLASPLCDARRFAAGVQETLLRLAGGDSV